MPSKELEKNKVKKIFILFCTIVFFILLLIISLFDTVSKSRRIPSLESTKTELSIRGDVISNDNFKISSSEKVYKVSIDTRCLNEDKIEIFTKLFSIYSGISEDSVKKTLSENKSRKGSLILSYNIDSKAAKNLKDLAFKLRQLDVFKSIKINGNTILIGLDVKVSGERRIFSYKDTLTPIIGFTRKKDDDNDITRVYGGDGLEKYYDSILNENRNDGILKGERDVLSYISFNKNSIVKNREDGNSVILNIPLRLQKNIELILDRYKEKLGADEVIASVMESDTGKIISLASSNRFDPDNITQEDIPNLTVSAVTYQFEPGSILKPVTMALVLDKNRAKDDELLFAYNTGSKNSKGEFKKGSYKIEKFRIKDDHQFTKNYLTLDDIIVYSSNIGILQLAQRLNGQEFSDGLKSFGITEKTGIDLSYERVGVLPKVYQFSAGESRNEDNVYKATVSYGQGMTATFMQMLRAYSVFNNNGKLVTPKIVSKIIDEKSNLVKNFESSDSKKIVSDNTAEKIKKMLIKTVKSGTGEITDIEGLEIGGKTGTAQIAERGEYQRKYISSFFGFVNDKNSKYTLGVTVFNPISTGKYWYYYYASNSAVPVYREITETLVKLNYLKKNL